MALQVGFVYVLSNPSMQGIVKVGYTSRLSEDRAREAYGTGVPTPFNVGYRRMTSNPSRVERRAHELLSRHRVNPRREFFSTDVDEAAAAIEQACQEFSGIQHWKREGLVTLRARDNVALTLRRNQLLVPLAYSVFGGWKPEDIWQAHADGDLLHLMVRSSVSGMVGFSEDDPEGYADPVPHLDRARDVANWPIVGRERLRPGSRLIWLEDSSSLEDCTAAVFEFGEHCQIVCRTQTLMPRTDGLSLLLNDFTVDPSPAAVSAIRKVLETAPPRVLEVEELRANRPVNDEAESVTPTYWLPQLKKP